MKPDGLINGTLVLVISLAIFGGFILLTSRPWGM